MNNRCLITLKERISRVVCGLGGTHPDEVMYAQLPVLRQLGSFNLHQR